MLGVVLLVLGLQLFDSPKERQLKRELASYERQVKRMKETLARDEEVLANLEMRDNNIYRTLLEAEPIGNDRRRSGIPVYNDNAAEQDELIAETSRRLDDLTKRIYVQSKSFDEVYEMVSNKKERYECIPAIMPLRKNQCQIISGFGSRYHPILHYSRMHTGVDLSAKTGTPIFATGDGVVVTAGRDDPSLSGYGIAVLIDHGFGYKTLYAHMSSTKVKKGQKVKRGELIGLVGSTGLSSGPHCHYEVWLNNKKVNPVYYFYNDLTPSEYEQVIEAAKQENQCLS